MDKLIYFLNSNTGNEVWKVSQNSCSFLCISVFGLKQDCSWNTKIFEDGISLIHHSCLKYNKDVCLQSLDSRAHGTAGLRGLKHPHFYAVIMFQIREVKEMWRKMNEEKVDQKGNEMKGIRGRENDQNIRRTLLRDEGTVPIIDLYTFKL